jgi:hypothetical protein
LVVAKFQALAELERAQSHALGAVYLAIDTDRAASSKAATRIAWRDAMGRQHALKVTPSGTDTLDFRHLVTGPRRLEWVAATLAAYLRQMPGRRATWLARPEVLRPQFAPAEPLSYGSYAATVILWKLRGDGRRGAAQWSA